MNTLLSVLWVTGTMAGSLSLGLIFLQFAIWLFFGLSEEEQQRELFRPLRHRTVSYGDLLIWRGINPRLSREARHAKLREIFQTSQHKWDKAADEIIKRLLAKQDQTQDQTDPHIASRTETGVLAFYGLVILIFLLWKSV